MNIDIQSILKKNIHQALQALGREGELSLDSIHLEHPADLVMGDFSTNIALALAKKTSKNSLTLAAEIMAAISSSKPQEIAKVEVAGPGFINFYLDHLFLKMSVAEIVSKEGKVGANTFFAGKMVAVEYTDPNPFKQFHIGHLMTNIIGESLARLYEFSGADVKRLCYQGDVGRHVALTLWGLRFMDKPFPSDEAPLAEKTAFLGAAYALGSKKIKEDPTAEIEIKEINRKIYERSDEELNAIYAKGREWSLEHFEEIYAVLGTKFDQYFFESVTGPIGKKIVEEHPDIFEKSEGAVVFPESKSGLHTRVFINSEGLPTYEAKELGLAKVKYAAFPYDLGISITGNEQNDYFKVLLKALSFIFPEIAAKSAHLSHGMLRLAVNGGGSAKMSSRTGDVITGESLLKEMIASAEEKIKDRPSLTSEEKKEIAKAVAVSAIKYSILKQATSKDIIFDKEKSLSFEGDSGPYLQYSYVRAMSVIKKSVEKNELEKKEGSENIPAISELERKLYRFGEVVSQACQDQAPHTVAQYLLEMAAAFNSFYASTPILPAGSEREYRLSLVKAFAIVMKNGLWLLGISAPEKM
ncbi:MAG: arginine--tRNA ligase [Candidatus Pacebacteria bacterium]|nr:arginine--tRNA ligase [Candidatus Paceibacterota bacterium]